MDDQGNPGGQMPLGAPQAMPIQVAQAQVPVGMGYPQGGPPPAPQSMSPDDAMALRRSRLADYIGG